MKQEYIPYAHPIIDEQELAAIASPGKVRLMPCFDCYQVRPNDIAAAVGMAIPHAHCYDGHTVCSHSAALQTCPETPSISWVLLRHDASDNLRMDNFI